MLAIIIFHYFVFFVCAAGSDQLHVRFRAAIRRPRRATVPGDEAAEALGALAKAPELRYLSLAQPRLCDCPGMLGIHICNDDDNGQL